MTDRTDQAQARTMCIAVNALFAQPRKRELKHSEALNILAQCRGAKNHHVRDAAVALPRALDHQETAFQPVVLPAHLAAIAAVHPDLRIDGTASPADYETVDAQGFEVRTPGTDRWVGVAMTEKAVYTVTMGQTGYILVAMAVVDGKTVSTCIAVLIDADDLPVAEEAEGIVRTHALGSGVPLLELHVETPSERLVRTVGDHLRMKGIMESIYREAGIAERAIEIIMTMSRWDGSLAVSGACLVIGNQVHIHNAYLVTDDERVRGGGCVTTVWTKSEQGSGPVIDVTVGDGERILESYATQPQLRDGTPVDPKNRLHLNKAYLETMDGAIDFDVHGGPLDAHGGRVSLWHDLDLAIRHAVRLYIDLIG